MQPSKTAGLAVASLVLGIVWVCGVGSLLALIFGIVALSQINKANPPGSLTGKGMAIAGAVLGAVGSVVMVIVIIAAIANGGSTTTHYYNGSDGYVHGINSNGHLCSDNPDSTLEGCDGSP